MNPAFEAQTGLRAADVLGRTVREVLPHTEEFFIETYARVVETGEVARFEHRAEALGRVYRVIAYRTAPAEFATIFADVTQETRLKDEARRATEALQTTLRASQAIQERVDPAGRARELARACVQDLGAALAWVGRAEPDGSVSVLAEFPEDHPYPRQIRVRHDETPEGQGPTGRAVRTGQVQVVQDLAADPSFSPWREAALSHGLACSAAFPLISRGQVFGALNVYGPGKGFFDAVRLQALESLANIAAAALLNADLFQKAGRRLDLVTSLRAIDMAITASLDPRVTLDVLLDHVTSHLRVDAAAVLRLDEVTLELRHAASRGFRSRFIEQTQVPLGRGYAGRAASERCRVSCADLAAATDFLRGRLAAEEGFVAYDAVPMVSKNRVLGVLETFHRQPKGGDAEWREALDALAAQAAIAIENAEMFSDLERRNLDLRLAYEATIEGWSRAMDLRDKETEGHTQRVTDLTVRLARRLGLPEERIVHIRRGALLHDMGKLGVPDHILLKPGPLTDEEWVVMRQHTTFAYEMLYPIEYLRPALDIPYCHHEKWDGSGYPRGLRGREIPIAARIFALVDVWDALTSDRPYRPAWPREKVLALIRDGAGSHFDPDLIGPFLEEIGEQVP